jgi:hypothetical protein
MKGAQRLNNAWPEAVQAQVKPQFLLFIVQAHQQLVDALTSQQGIRVVHAAPSSPKCIVHSVTAIQLTQLS